MDARRGTSASVAVRIENFLAGAAMVVLMPFPVAAMINWFSYPGVGDGVLRT